MDEKLEKYLNERVSGIRSLVFAEIHGFTSEPNVFSICRDIYFAGCAAQSVADREAVESVSPEHDDYPINIITQCADAVIAASIVESK